MCIYIFHIYIYTPPPHSQKMLVTSSIFTLSLNSLIEPNFLLNPSAVDSSHVRSRDRYLKITIIFKLDKILPFVYLGFLSSMVWRLLERDQYCSLNLHYHLCRRGQRASVVVHLVVICQHLLVPHPF